MSILDVLDYISKGGPVGLAAFVIYVWYQDRKERKDNKKVYEEQAEESQKRLDNLNLDLQKAKDDRLNDAKEAAATILRLSEAQLENSTESANAINALRELMDRRLTEIDKSLIRMER